MSTIDVKVMHKNLTCRVLFVLFVLGAEFLSIQFFTTAALAELPNLDTNSDGHVVISCNGDSNTQVGWQAAEGYSFLPSDGWCERVGEMLQQYWPGATTINRGVGGSGIINVGQYFSNVPGFGSYYLENEINGTDPFYAISGSSEFLSQQTYPDGFPDVDIFILAWGTNDLRMYGTPTEVIAAYQEAKSQLEAAGAKVIIATVPPIRFLDAALDKLVRQTNSMIRSAFPNNYVDFYGGMGRRAFEFTLPLGGKFSDGIHLGVYGQSKRALEVYRRLSRNPIP